MLNNQPFNLVFFGGKKYEFALMIELLKNCNQDTRTKLKNVVPLVMRNFTFNITVKCILFSLYHKTRYI